MEKKHVNNINNFGDPQSTECRKTLKASVKVTTRWKTVCQKISQKAEDSTVLKTLKGAGKNSEKRDDKFMISMMKSLTAILGEKVELLRHFKERFYVNRPSESRCWKKDWVKRLNSEVKVIQMFRYQKQ